MMEDVIRHIQGELAAKDHLLRLGSLFFATVLLRIDDEEYYLTFEKGRLTDYAIGTSRKTPWNFAITTDSEALSQFWQTYPKPGFHDLFGLVKIGRARIDGDILLLVKNLRYFKEVMALPRARLANTKESAS